MLRVKKIKFETDKLIQTKRVEYLSVDEFFKVSLSKEIEGNLFKHKFNKTDVQYKKTNLLVFNKNYQDNNNVCKCSICGAKATHIVLVKNYDNKATGLNPKFCTIKNGKEVHFNIDYIIPTSKGGTSVFDNLQVACVDCNFNKDNNVKLNNVAKSIKTILNKNVSNNNFVNEINKSKGNNVPGPKPITNNVAKPIYKNNIVFKQCYKINNVGLEVVWNSTMFANNV